MSRFELSHEYLAGKKTRAYPIQAPAHVLCVLGKGQTVIQGIFFYLAIIILSIGTIAAYIVPLP